MQIHYFAYGSNLHPVRLGARVPSAELLGVAELPGHELRFCKRSVDASAKCTVSPGRESQQVFGAVFRIGEREKVLLDRAEGLGSGYSEASERLAVAGRPLDVFYYVAEVAYVDPDLQPYHWYKQLVLAGARYHGFPDRYVAWIESVESMDDPDAARRAANEALVRDCLARG
jgi:gamma-glutamylcyclotransferase